MYKSFLITDVSRHSLFLKIKSCKRAKMNFCILLLRNCGRLVCLCVSKDEGFVLYEPAQMLSYIFSKKNTQTIFYISPQTF